jgi:hypothetical protein
MDGILSDAIVIVLTQRRKAAKAQRGKQLVEQSPISPLRLGAFAPLR